MVFCLLLVYCWHLGGDIMFFLLQVTAPTSITVDTFVIGKLAVAFIGLAGVCWGIRKLLDLINRS